MAETISTMRSLVYKHEQTLFVLMLIISLAFWGLLVVGTVGVALIYLLIGFIFYLFIQSAFIAYIKGTGVHITSEQLPDLHSRVVMCCNKLGQKPLPEAYLLHANGIFNALATRFLGRNFIILYSDIVDALEERPEALNFYIGHELGHIKRGHLVWGLWLWPAGLLPIIGAAYSRSREYTCDHHGTACCASPEDGRRALAALAAGGSRWKTINLDRYSHQDVTGFWMSFHELIADYPWLVKRMLMIDPVTASHQSPGRHPLAWLFALFVPRLGTGGSALIFIASIGIIAAVAIPAYSDYIARAQLTEGLTLVAPAKACIEEYYSENQITPETNDECGIAPPDELSGKYTQSISISDGGIITVLFRDSGVATAIAGQTLVFQALLDEQDRLIWDCHGGTVEEKFRPSGCRASTIINTP